MPLQALLSRMWHRQLGCVIKSPSGDQHSILLCPVLTLALLCPCTTVLGPLWSLLVFRMRPLSYIRMVVVLVVVQLLVALVCLLESKFVNLGLILTSACALSGNPFMALGYLGKETTTEVAEVSTATRVGCWTAAGKLACLLYQHADTLLGLLPAGSYLHL
jgi:hypothetical protein